LRGRPRERGKRKDWEKDTDFARGGKTFLDRGKRERTNLLGGENSRLREVGGERV